MVKNGWWVIKLSVVNSEGYRIDVLLGSELLGQSEKNNLKLIPHREDFCAVIGIDKLLVDST